MADDVVVQGTKARGASAFTFAVLSAAVAVVGWLVVYAITAATGGMAGGGALGVLVAAADALVGLVVGLVQRLAMEGSERVNLRTVAALAVGIPMGVTALWSLVLALFG